MSFLHKVDRLLPSSVPGLPSGDARAWPGFDAGRLRKPRLRTPRLSHRPLLQRGSRERVAVTWLPTSPVAGPPVEGRPVRSSVCRFISSFQQPPTLMGKGNLSRSKRFAQKGSPRKRQSGAGLSPGLQPMHMPLSFLGVPWSCLARPVPSASSIVPSEV